MRHARLLLALLPIVLSLGSATFARAEWMVELRPIQMEVHGHDQHVLTVHGIDLDATPAVDDATAVSLETQSDLGYGAELLWDSEPWGFGLDLLVFRTSQKAADRFATAGAPIDTVVFEAAGESFASTGPDEMLFYRVLEDTDLEIWTLDLYALRELTSGEGADLRLQLGLRLGDFDNDYHAVLGIEGVGGTRLDASSNYDRMMGPLVGLVATLELGRHSLDADLGQSLLLGTAEKLSSASGRFGGPFDDTPAFFEREAFRDERDVAIPISELRIHWRVRVGEHLSLGLGADTSVWWDVTVPPGVVPGPGGNEVLHENTIVFTGFLGVVSYTF